MNVNYWRLYQQIDPALSWTGRRLSGKNSRVPQGEPPRVHRAWNSAVIFSLWKFGICEPEHTHPQWHHPVWQMLLSKVPHSKPAAYIWSSDWPCGSLTFDLCCVSPVFYRYSSESAFLKRVLRFSFESTFSWSSSAHRVRQWVIDRSDNSLDCSLWAALQGVGLNHWQRFWLSHGFLFMRLMNQRWSSSV